MWRYDVAPVLHLRSKKPLILLGKLDLLRQTPTYAARRVSEIRKRLKALAHSAAKTKKRYVFDYCLTTRKQKAYPRQSAQVEHTCPWRSG